MKVAIATRFGGSPEDFVRRFPDVEFVVVPDGAAVPPLPDVEACVGGPNPDRLRAVLAAAPRLRWFHTVSAGVERMVIPELSERADLVLTNNTGSYDVPIAEFVLGMIFTAAKRIPVHLANQRERAWRDTMEHAELRDATLVVLGLGSIGTELARLARGLRMRVLGVRRSGRPSPEVERVVIPDRLAEVGSTPSANARRELREETGFEGEIERLLGVFDNRVYGSRHPYHFYILLFRARLVGGEATTSAESIDVAFFARAELPADMAETQHAMIEHAFADPSLAAFQ